MAKKTKEKKSKEKKSKDKKAAPSGKNLILLAGGLFSSLVFLPSTIVLFVGILPSLAALFTVNAKTKIKVVTIGAMNFAGCMPFLLQLWSQGHTFENSLRIVFNPINIVIMYAAAAAGAMLDWGITGIVSGVLHQKGLLRQKSIVKRQEELIERWGREVTGQVMLDEYGFRVKKHEEEL